jgi:hypothetical protein
MFAPRIDKKSRKGPLIKHRFLAPKEAPNLIVGFFMLFASLLGGRSFSESEAGFFPGASGSAERSFTPKQRTVSLPPASSTPAVYRANETSELHNAWLKHCQSLDQKTRNFIGQLHPEMRFPAMMALQDIERAGIDIHLAEAWRDPSRQDALIKTGHSKASAGYSFHGPMGASRGALAMDIAPTSVLNRQDWNPTHPDWGRIQDIMQTHGFYSLGASKGWDQPHFQLPARSSDMVRWPVDSDGNKMIPDHILPSKY